MQKLDCDILIIGGGAAGSRAAYEAKKAHPELRVLMAVAGGFGTSGSTNLMASESLGINAPFNYMEDGDSPEVYYHDMIETGGGLGDPLLCKILADEARDRVKELVALGMKFDSKNGKIIQRKLSGCTKARSLTCGGSTGKEIVRVLKTGITKLGVEVLENVRILDLVQDDHGRICGAVGLAIGKPIFIGSRAVVLANGGAGRIFQHNVNPISVEGDGWCMAYRAGARLVNMEFFQMGPAVYKPNIMFIIHSHMWRLRPRLTNALGEEFLPKYCPHGVDPAEVIVLKAMSYPFSVRTAAKYLDIAIFKEVMDGRGTESGGIYFDVTHVGQDILLERAPITYRTLKQAGADLAKERIEIGMVVQNFNGGIFIDSNGFTGIEGLFAAGEVTGGVHGADRPGGNNLIDTQVFGYRAGKASAEYAATQEKKPREMGLPFEFEPLTQEDELLIAKSADLYYRNLTIVRTQSGLEEVLQFIDSHRENRNFMVKNRLLLGSVLATAALTRKESRGTHYREDFPQNNPAWVKKIIIFQGKEGIPAADILT
ncbi:MAG: FAD-binding protein [Thermodesulfobacteriota bacterium]|nr:FAD-binding protein [Thermodesulfobacteriota bacterium]